MQQSLITTLAGISDWIGPIVILAFVVGPWIGSVLKKSGEQRQREEGGVEVSAELDQMAAHRREQLRQAARQRTRMQAPSGLSPGEPGNMTMAERIARARAKAQYEQRAQGEARPTQASQPQVPNEAQRRVLAQRQAAEVQQRAQQQTQRRAQRQVQQRTRQQQAQAHAQAQAQARQRGRLLHEPTPVPKPTTSTVRRLVPSRPKRSKTPPAHPVPVATFGTLDLSKPLSRADLRNAIILKEVFDKPIALRDSSYSF